MQYRTTDIFEESEYFIALAYHNVFDQALINILTVLKCLNIFVNI